MTKTDNLYIGQEARERMMRGVRKSAEAVGATMGTAGSNSLIECIERPQHFPTNDGATILANIKLADQIEEMGRSVLYEAVSRANRSSGDGSSTTCVLTAAILEEGMKHIGEKSPMEIKRSLEDCIPLIEEEIKSQKKEVGVDGVAQAASISAEDEKIGKLIQEIYQKIGPEGIIQWDISKTADDSYTLGTGLTITGATYVAPYMCDENSTEVRIKNPKILLARKKITTALDFETLFPALYAQDIKEIVIFCDEIDVNVVSDLAKTQRIRGFRAVVVKMPVLWREEWWEDLAVVTGGKVIDMASGIKLSDATLEHLGTLENITITKEDTYLDGIKDPKKHILALQVEGSDRSLLRASRLNTKTARYFVGAHSDSALSHRRLKVEDAINAAACAINDGVVAGGGVALKMVSDRMKDQTIGEKILKVALKEPFNRILKNARIETRILPENCGVDTRTGEAVDMFEAGIVDPASVVINAVKNAIGVAATILTVGTVVTLPIEEEKVSHATQFIR